jgi:hypothetical protein
MNYTSKDKASHATGINRVGRGHVELCRVIRASQAVDSTTRSGRATGEARRLTMHGGRSQALRATVLREIHMYT